ADVLIRGVRPLDARVRVSTIRSRHPARRSRILSRAAPPRARARDARVIRILGGLRPLPPRQSILQTRRHARRARDDARAVAEPRHAQAAGAARRSAESDRADFADGGLRSVVAAALAATGGCVDLKLKNASSLQLRVCGAAAALARRILARARRPKRPPLHQSSLVA